MAALLVLAAELGLHSDAFLERYRSVFAAGRAFDKTRYAETRCPSLLVLGNSRADNGFDPRTIRNALDFRVEREAFNLGVPGADTRVLAGIVDRIDSAGCLRDGGVRYAVLSLDEALVQKIDTLGQEVFLANRRQMWSDGQYHDALRTIVRLYGYSTNLRQLREPASLQRFASATLHDTDPVGGAAAQHLGYRAGTGSLQDMQSALKQDAGSLAPPDPVNLRHLWRMLDLFEARGVRVAVVFPPLLNRELLYVSASSSEAAPYRAIVDKLRRRQLPLITLDVTPPPRDLSDFVNVGHLNERGAQRYSRLLGQKLNRVWGADSPLPRDYGQARPAAS